MTTADPHAPNAVMVGRRDLNARVAIIHVRPDSGAIEPFVPGQFVQLGLPADSDRARTGNEGVTRTKLVRRSYSIASAPHQSETYELCVALVPGGLVTPRLFRLGVGDRLWHDAAPKGKFTLERVPYGVNLVLVATGTGIAPFVSMLRTQASDRLRWPRIVVVHGVREQSDLAYREELATAARADARIAYVPVLSREPRGSTWNGLRGHVQLALEPACFQSRAGFVLEASNSHVLLCGNPTMIDDLRVRLGERGFATDTPRTPGNVHFERYW